LGGGPSFGGKKKGEAQEGGIKGQGIKSAKKTWGRPRSTSKTQKKKSHGGGPLKENWEKKNGRGSGGEREPEFLK